MSTKILFNFIEIIIGFSGGLAVGSGFIAFLSVLGIIPRLTQLSKTKHLLTVYSACVVIGSIFGTFLSFTNIYWNLPLVILIIWGGFHGIFNGMLAAALTEILNVFPILSKRVRMKQYLFWLLMAIVFGKVFGSLFQWIIFER
ncbi:MAG TPA: stage V sporulation protein AB [Candidatus Dormibacteraeota bacterium]|nr:stage V sporulation protein AB [Candidatus Dormibacteraeota bacterium]